MNAARRVGFGAPKAANPSIPCGACTRNTFGAFWCRPNPGGSFRGKIWTLRMIQGMCRLKRTSQQADTHFTRKPRVRHGTRGTRKTESASVPSHSVHKKRRIRRRRTKRRHEVFSRRRRYADDASVPRKPHPARLHVWFRTRHMTRMGHANRGYPGFTPSRKRRREARNGEYAKLKQIEKKKQV
jgi:hypothetical protein